VSVVTARGARSGSVMGVGWERMWGARTNATTGAIEQVVIQERNGQFRDGSEGPVHDPDCRRESCAKVTWGLRTTKVGCRKSIWKDQTKMCRLSASENERGGNHLTLKLRKLFSIFPSFDIRRSSFTSVGAPN